MSWGFEDDVVTPDVRTHEVQRERIENPEGAATRVPPQLAMLLFERQHYAHELAKHLKNTGVSVFHAEGFLDALAFLRDQRPSIIVTHEDSDGVPALNLHTWLKEQNFNVPMVVLMGPSRHYGYTDGVRTVSKNIRPLDLSLIACRVLAHKPHLIVKAPPARENLPRSTYRRESLTADAKQNGLIRAIKQSATSALRHRNAHLERMGESFEARETYLSPSGQKYNMSVRISWRDADFQRFALELSGDLPRQENARFSLRAQRGVWAQLLSVFGRERKLDDAPLDEAYLIHADDRTLPLLQQERTTLLAIATDAVGVEQLDDRLLISLNQIPRHRAFEHLRLVTTLWDAALKNRIEAN